MNLKNLSKILNVLREERLELGMLNYIRNSIINSVYLLTCMVGTLAMLGTVMRIVRFGWQPFFVFNFLLYTLILVIYVFRRKVSLFWKSVVYFTIFFILACFINYTAGIISGALNFVFISTLLTLLLGWRAGVLSILLAFIVRLVIGLGYLKGYLHFTIDLNEYAHSPASMVTGLVGALVIASITVYAINKFYSWLLLSLKKASIKAEALQKKNEELLIAKTIAEENNKLKSAFLANMSHEIRTPMNAIVGFSTLLSKPDLTQNQRDCFTYYIQERSADLMQVITDILDFSKIEVGQLCLNESEFELNEFMLNLFDFYKVKLEKEEKLTSLKLECHISDEAKTLMVFYDKLLLKRILNNLINNSFKFTRNGMIEFGCKLDGESSILFWVKDTGIGIPQDKQSLIFDSFQQANDLQTSKQHSGTGLGLSIVQGIIKLMHGQIWVTSEEGKGSVFSFQLPLQVCKESSLS
jgi:signal transduction histidine kinase